jgi:hypothetical protein
MVAARIVSYVCVLIYFFIKFISCSSNKGPPIGSTARFRALLSSDLRGFLNHIQTGNKVPYLSDDLFART